MRLSAVKATFQSRKGFSLLEALVALVILSVALLATASMLFSSLAASAGANNRYVASVVAQGRVDELMKRPFSSLSSHKAPIQDVANGMRFFTNWTTASLGASLRSFTVNTTWTDKIGGHTVSLKGVRAP